MVNLDSDSHVDIYINNTNSEIDHYFECASFISRYGRKAIKI